jgi:hypothetical protein
MIVVTVVCANGLGNGLRRTWRVADVDPTVAAEAPAKEGVVS